MKDRERERGVRLPFLDRIPRMSYDVDIADTGGAFRPDWREQDPAKDTREPFGSESSAAGNDHGWANCTMVAAALGYAYEAGKQSGPQGGDMRHNQDDLTGGTDLYDARVAWERYGGHTLTIRNGAGWAAVEQAHSEGRAIVIQGEGNVPGSEAFDGGHACIIGPETRASDGYWLFGDPLASGWQWVSSKSIREWAQALDYDIMFAVGNTPLSGGGGGSSDVGNAVISSRPQLADVAAGVDFYESPGGARIGEMSKAFSGLKVVGVPMDASTDHMNLGWRAIEITTSAIDGVSSLKIVYVLTDDLTNLRAIPTEPTPVGEYEEVQNLYIKKS